MPLHKFTLQTLLIATVFASLLVASLSWLVSYRQFELALSSTQNSLQYLNNEKQAVAINDVTLEVRYSTRNKPILAFVGLHKQNDDRIAIFADWVCLNSPVDSIKIELSNADPLFVALEQGQFISDNNLRHHFSVFLDEIGAPNPKSIEGVSLISNSQELSGSKRAEEWAVDWQDGAG